MNTCAIFHGDSPSGQKVQFNLASCTLFKNQKQASRFGGTFDQPYFSIFFAIFTENALLLLLYHGVCVEKSRMTKLKIKGSCLIVKNETASIIFNEILIFAFL